MRLIKSGSSFKLWRSLLLALAITSGIQLSGCGSPAEPAAFVDPTAVDMIAPSSIALPGSKVAQENRQAEMSAAPGLVPEGTPLRASAVDMADPNTELSPESSLPTPSPLPTSGASCHACLKYCLQAHHTYEHCWAVCCR